MALLAPGLGAKVWDVPPERFEPVPANERIPARDFFRPFLFESPVLNHSGTYLAALFSNVYGDREMVLMNLKTGATDYRSAYWFDWLTDSLLLSFYTDGFHTGSQVVQVDDLEIKETDKFGGSVIGFPRSTRPPIFAWVARDSGFPLKIDALTGFEEARCVEPSGGACIGYSADKDGELAFSYTEKGGTLSVQRLVGDRWAKCPVDLEKVRIVGPGERPGELIVLGPRQPGRPRAVQRMDAISGRLGEVLYQDRRYDFNGGSLYRSRMTGKILGIQFNRRISQAVWFDPKYQKIQEQLDLRFPGMVVGISGSDDSERHLIVWTYSDVDPGAYYLLDLEKHSVGLLKKSAPWIDPARMRPMRAFLYLARDGIPIEAYLTLPVGASKENPSPLVVLPHEGPWERSNWGYSAEVQFLASRGYAVFQPNYRGSRGYEWRFPDEDGWDFEKMRVDVADGVRFLAKSGLIDRNRIAIMGSGFGGYLAVCGAAFDPGIYRCAVAMSSSFDIERMVKESRVYLFSDNVAYDILERHLVAPDASIRNLDRISPLLHVDRIGIPVFLYYSRGDVVGIAEGKRLVSALKAKHITCEETEPKRNNITWTDYYIDEYTAIESFLEKNMPAPKPAGAVGLGKGAAAGN